MESFYLHRMQNYKFACSRPILSLILEKDLRGTIAKGGVILVDERFDLFFMAKDVVYFITQPAGANAMNDDQVWLMMGDGLFVMFFKGFYLQVKH
jgi:hypothetical protein